MSLSARPLLGRRLWAAAFNSVPLATRGRIAATAAATIHTSNKCNGTQYYPINDNVLGLTEDQKQVYTYSCMQILFHRQQTNKQTIKKLYNALASCVKLCSTFAKKSSHPKPERSIS